MDIITKFDRIEDILGSPDGRYFGNGYTQVKYFRKLNILLLKELSQYLKSTIRRVGQLRKILIQ